MYSVKNNLSQPFFVQWPPAQLKFLKELLEVRLKRQEMTTPTSGVRKVGSHPNIQ
jgi:hypothetical protein